MEIMHEPKPKYPHGILITHGIIANFGHGKDCGPVHHVMSCKRGDDCQCYKNGNWSRCKLLQTEQYLTRVRAATPLSVLVESNIKNSKNQPTLSDKTIEYYILERESYEIAKEVLIKHRPIDGSAYDYDGLNSRVLYAHGVEVKNHRSSVETLKNELEGAKRTANEQTECLRVVGHNLAKHQESSTYSSTSAYGYGNFFVMFNINSVQMCCTYITAYTYLFLSYNARY